jgi:hypothetical protein
MRSMADPPQFTDDQQPRGWSLHFGEREGSGSHTKCQDQDQKGQNFSEKRDTEIQPRPRVTLTSQQLVGHLRRYVTKCPLPTHRVVGNANHDGAITVRC